MPFSSSSSSSFDSSSSSSSSSVDSSSSSSSQSESSSSSTQSSSSSSFDSSSSSSSSSTQSSSSSSFDSSSSSSSISSSSSSSNSSSSSSSSVTLLDCDEFTCTVNCSGFDTVVLNGATNHNTDDGTLYIDFTGAVFPPGSPNPTQDIDVYKDVAKTALVASFSGTDLSPALTATLDEENASGLSGTLRLLGIITSQSSTVVCDNFSSSSSSSVDSSSSSSLSSSSSGGYSSSSSSSIDSSSSSSSSLFDISDSRTIPFTLEIEKVYPIKAMTFDGEDVYVGTTASEGVVIRSTDRFTWSLFYKVDDIIVSALLAHKDKLYIGTSPKGKIYIYDLILNTVSESQELGKEVVDIVNYDSRIFAFTGSPADVYEYDSVNDKWDFSDDLYGGTLYKTVKALNKLYVMLNESNLVSFDGSNWKKETSLVENVSSFRRVARNPFSHTDSDYVARTGNTVADDLNGEDALSIFPINHSDGIRSAAADGNSMVIGSSRYGRIYNLDEDVLTPMFQSDSSSVHALLNLEVGVNLAAIDNKLYLIHCGDLPVATTTTTTTGGTTTTTTTTEAVESKITVTAPTDDSSPVVGEILEITWASTESISDSVRIDLYKNGELLQLINPNTRNDGAYLWSVPFTLLAGSDYSVNVAWLSAGEIGSIDQDRSEEFSILVTATTTTTSTTTVSSGAKPDLSSCRGIPIMELPDDEYITIMEEDVAKGGILFATSKGRIISASTAIVNSYLTGDRKIYAEVWDGFSNVSDTRWTDLTYSLYHKIAQINAEKEIKRWHFERSPSAITTDRIEGTFLSPILVVNEDLGSWKNLLWREDKPANTDVVICVRAADTSTALQETPFDVCFTSIDSDSGVITRDLMNTELSGKYIQFKVTTTTDVKDITPTVINISITYSTKFALYFFTTKFSLQRDSDVSTGLIVANITEPQNTEIIFGVANNNSADWNDYQVVEPDKFFSVTNQDDIKVGIKMVSYDDTSIPEVAEFALMTGSQKDNIVGEYTTI